MESLRRRREHKEEVEQEITEQELDCILGEASKEKTAGDDDIPHEFLQNLGPKAKNMLLHLYNLVWEGKESSEQKPSWVQIEQIDGRPGVECPGNI